MITWREFWALLIAGMWDFIQIAALAWVGDLLNYLVDRYLGGFELFGLVDLTEPLLFCGGSVLISLVLASLLGPHWALLPVFVLENIPIVKLFPSNVAGVFVVIRHRHQLSRQELSDS